MSIKRNSKTDPVQPIVYQIRIECHLDHQWADWFDELSVTTEADGVTLLSGPVPDQPALYGLLKKVRDLGMPLISVNRVNTDRADASAVEPSNPI